MANVLTKEIMKKITGRDVDERYIVSLNEHMIVNEINTLPRIEFFIAIACGETGGFRSVSENMNYTSADRIRQVFRSRFHQNDDMSQYVSNARNLANRVYGGRYGNGTVNGPEETKNDGYVFRGAGIFQLTFRANFQTLADDLGVEISALTTSNSGYCLRDPNGAVISACHYFKTRRNGIMIREADKNTPESFIAACRAVGNCPDGNNYATKRRYWEKCKKYISGSGIRVVNRENTRLTYLTPTSHNVFLEARNKMSFTN